MPLHPACSLCRQVEDIVELEADSDSTRPAFAIGVDHKARQVGDKGAGRPNWSWQLGEPGLDQASIVNGVAPCAASAAAGSAVHPIDRPHVAPLQVVLAFRGTTDLNDMLTDACATW